MALWQRPSAVSLLAAHLRGELERGRWSGKMPGVIRLADELGVARNTAEGALKALEREGLLVRQGRGRGRLIRLQGSGLRSPGLRVGLLVGEAPDLRLDYILELRQLLADAGHMVQIPSKSLLDFGMDVRRVARMAEQHEVDAWVVVAASGEVLEWFAARATPVFALFGRRRHLLIAGTGPDKVAAMAAATRELIALGHKRIVLLARRMRRLPNPGTVEQAFLDELKAGGVDPGSYHLPDWEESVNGFHERLEGLFRVTPPTALILDEVAFFMAALDFCANRGLRVPRDLSLICQDASPDFHWCRPEVSHIRWASGPVVKRIMQWVGHVSRGRKDLRQTSTAAEFVAGGTIGVARRIDDW